MLDLLFLLCFLPSINSQLIEVFNATESPLDTTTLPDGLASAINLLPAHLVELVPCQCDQTSPICDYNCCCDADCDEDTIVQYFECAAGDDVLPCSVPSHILARHPITRFMCEFRTTTPYLGTYFNYPQQLVDNAQDFNMLVQNKFSESRSFGYFVQERTAELESNTYIQHSAIPTNVGYLTLPQAILHGGACSLTAPVTFLDDRSTECITTVTSETCELDEILNYKKYLKVLPLGVDTTTNARPFSTASRQSNQLTPTVTYLCETSATTSPTSTTTDPNYFNTYDQEYFDRIDSNPIATTPCSTFQQSTPQLVTGTVSKCSNVVRSVEYAFTWNASTIVDVKVRVVIANLTIPTKFAQQFNIKWQHLSKTTAPVTNDPPRSGNPGYTPGKPLIAAYESGSGLRYDRRRQVYGWKNDITNLCSSASLTRIHALHNTTTACLLRLPIGAFDDCSTLIGRIEEGFNQLIPVTHLSQLGTVVLNDGKINQELAVPILRQSASTEATDFAGSQLLMSTDSTSTVQSSTASQTTATTDNAPNPTTSRTTSATSPSLTSPATTPSPTSSSTSPTSSATTLLDSSSMVKRQSLIPQARYVCMGIPTEMHLDILYARSTVAGDVEIVGARAFYNYSTLRYSGEDRKNEYLLTSTVRYYEVPAVVDEKRSRWSYARGRFACPSLVTCWDDLFHPMTKRVQGTPYPQALAMSLAGIFGVVGIYMVTKPWAL